MDEALKRIRLMLEEQRAGLARIEAELGRLSDAKVPSEELTPRIPGAPKAQQTQTAVYTSPSMPVAAYGAVTTSAPPVRPLKRERPLAHPDNDEKKQERSRTNIENFLGLNLLNKLGILLLIIGVIAGLQFTYARLPDALKSVLAFSFGTLLLVTGEIMNRKKAGVFSIGLTGGGVAVLYAALAVSFFYLHMLPEVAAIIICVAITALSFFLAVHHKSQTISVFAIVGGYLPVLSSAFGSGAPDFIMAYLFALNLYALLTASGRKWYATQFVSFSLNVASAVFLVYDLGPTSIEGIKCALYVLMGFVIYDVIPIARAMLKSHPIEKPDIVLIAINTVASAFLMYAVLHEWGFTAYRGLASMSFALAYGAAGFFIERKLTHERVAMAVFYITALTFAVLAVPLQFGVIWLTLGWLIEGTGLLTYGLLSRRKGFTRAGWILCGLCMYTFLSYDVVRFIDDAVRTLFTWKYLAMTLSSAVILATMVLAGRADRVRSWMMRASAVNLWLFASYLITQPFDRWIAEVTRGQRNVDLMQCTLIAVSYAFAYAYRKVRALADEGMRYISIGIYAVAIILALTLNTSPIPRVAATSAISAVSVIVMGLLNVLTVAAVYELAQNVFTRRARAKEIVAIAVSAFAVASLTQILIVQFSLGISSLIISTLYIVAALAWVICGFIRRYQGMRRFGLVLSFVAVAKLFVVDLAFLSSGARIVSYFAFGLTLLAISFVYQFFVKRLEPAPPPQLMENENESRRNEHADGSHTSGD